MIDLPSGTVTFLFTDIEGSTALWEQDRSAMAAAVERHLAILRARGGIVCPDSKRLQQALTRLRSAAPSQHHPG